MIIRRFETNPFTGSTHAFSELDRLRSELGRLINSTGDGHAGWATQGVYPLLNVSEKGDHFLVRSELPGMELKDIDLSVTGNSLSISGERKIAEESDQVKYLRREREGGVFRRLLHLPTEIDPGKVEAQYQQGVLTVSLPKAEKVKPKKISITAK